MTDISNEENRAFAHEIRTGFQLVRLMTSLFPPLAVAGGLEPPTTGLTIRRSTN